MSTIPKKRTTKKDTTVNLNIDMKKLAEMNIIDGQKNITILEKTNKNKLLSTCSSSFGDVHCFWDKCKINRDVYKCPVRKIYRSKTTTYKSDINGNVYTIRDSLNVDDAVYDTDGYFCSEECMMAFVDDVETINPLYENSRSIICSLLGRTPKSAPNWRTLMIFGGHLTIEKFREGFSNKSFELFEISTNSFPFVYKFKEVYHI